MSSEKTGPAEQITRELSSGLQDPECSPPSRSMLPPRTLVLLHWAPRHSLSCQACPSHLSDISLLPILPHSVCFSKPQLNADRMLLFFLNLSITPQYPEEWNSLLNESWIQHLKLLSIASSSSSSPSLQTFPSFDFPKTLLCPKACLPAPKISRFFFFFYQNASVDPPSPSKVFFLQKAYCGWSCHTWTLSIPSSELGSAHLLMLALPKCESWRLWAFCEGHIQRKWISLWHSLWFGQNIFRGKENCYLFDQVPGFFLKGTKCWNVQTADFINCPPPGLCC